MVIRESRALQANRARRVRKATPARPALRVSPVLLQVPLPSTTRTSRSRLMQPRAKLLLQQRILSQLRRCHANETECDFVSMTQPRIETSGMINIYYVMLEHRFTLLCSESNFQIEKNLTKERRTNNIISSKSIYLFCFLPPIYNYNN